MIYNIKYSENFLKQLAIFINEKIINKDPAFVLNSIIILPNKNSIRELMIELRKLNSHNTLLPKILQISYPVDESNEFQAIKEKLILSDIISNHNFFKNLSKFDSIQISNQLYDLFIKLNLFETDIDTNTVTELQIVLTLKNIFDKKINNSIPYKKIKYTSNLIEICENSNGLVIAAGIDTFIEKEISLLNVINANKNGYFFFYGLEDEFTNKVHKKMLDKLDDKYSIQTEHNPIRKNKINLINVKNKHSQSEIIALIVHQILSQTPSQKIGIITNSKDTEKQIKNSLQKYSIFAKQTLGKTYDKTKNGIYAILSAKLLFEERSTFYIMSLLSNEITKIEPEDFKKLDLFIKQLRFIPSNFSKILKSFNPDNGNYIFSEISKLPQFDKIMDFYELFQIHYNFIKKISLLNDEFLNRLSQIINKAYNIGEINTLDYPKILKHILENITYPQEENYNNNVQIIGRIEAKLLNFDTIIFSDFNDDTFPGEQKNNFWLSINTQENIGIYNSELDIDLKFSEFIQHTYSKNCFIVRYTNCGNEKTIKSRFLNLLENANLISEDLYFSSILEKISLPSRITPSHRPAPTPPVEIRPNKLSVTEIGNFMRNPYFIYAKHILNLKKLNEFNLESLHSIRGQVIHKMLDSFIKLRINKSPTNLSLIKEKVLNELLLDEKDLGFWLVKLDDFYNWFENIVNKILIHAKESYSEIRGSYTFKINDSDFSLLCTADRIDWLKENSISIIDYKTGTIPTQKEIIAGFSPQLHLEGAIAMNGGFLEELPTNIAKIEIWKMNRANNSEIIPLPFNNLKMSQAALNGLIKVLIKFANKNTPYVAYPRPDITIKGDPYYHLARVQEWETR